MTIIDTIKSLVWPNPSAPVSPTGVKAFTTNGYTGISGDAFGPLGQRNADWSSVTDMPRIQDAYRKCSIAYACVTLLADAVAESPLRVYETVDGELEERPEHRMRTLLANPNPYMSEAEFVSLIVMTAGMFGYAVVEKVRSAARLPVELWPLRPDWLKFERTNDGGGWRYREPGRDPRPIADDDLIVIPYRHDERQVSLGISPLQIIAREIGIDVALTDLLKIFIDSGGIPPWVVKFSGDMTMDQAAKDAFRLRWRQMFGGSQAYQNIGILDPNMDLVKVGDSIGDMAWPDLRGLTEMKICQAFRVPADLVQARDSMSSGSLTTTEMLGSMAFLQNHGAQPLRMRIDGAFTRGLLPDFGLDATYSLEFDTSDILALQEDEDARHMRWRANFDAGMVTLNEARQAIDLPDLGSDGDVLKISFTTTLQPIGGVNDVQPPQRATAAITARSGGNIAISDKSARTYRDLKALSPGEIETRASIIQTVQRDRQRLTEIGNRKLKAFFKAQGRRMVASLPKSAGVVEIKAAVDWSEEERILRDLLETFYAATGERAFSTVSSQLDATIDWSLFNPRIRDLMADLGLRITGIHDETRTQVVQVITDGMSEGLSLPEIAGKLTEKFDEFSTSRAMTVARTESAHAYNKASALGYAESGVVSQVELDDNPEHDTEPMEPTNTTCADRAGLVVGVDEIFGYTDSMHPNCVMSVIPLLDTPLGESESGL